MKNFHFPHRMRRLRKNQLVRDLVADYSLSSSDFIYPVFLTERPLTQPEEILSMPQIYRYSLEQLLFHMEKCHSLGIRAIALFPQVLEQNKDEMASYALRPDHFLPQAIRRLKKEFPDLLIMTDVALDPYSSYGHDGLLNKEKTQVLNDETLEVLSKMALVQLEAGADILGPSDMMDYRIKHLRETCEAKGFVDAIILSYAAKYASAFYGPFREALDSAPKNIALSGKGTYQLDFRRSRKEAIREALLDEQEGADILMVKPGMPYLDIVSLLSEKSLLPIAVYQVSGEYSSLMSASAAGYLKEEEIFLESFMAFKRAGAKIILSYWAPKICQLLS